jgi:hypothetical protein
MGDARELKRLLTLRRLSNEQVRVSLDEFDAPRGQTVRYVNFRKWEYRRGQWYPTHVGITLRLSELGKVVECLQRLQACATGQQNQPHNGETREDIPA